MKKQIISTIIVSILFTSINLVALENSALDELALEQFWLKEEAFVITATKTQESVKKIATPISVITQYDIQNMGARHLHEVLATIPGLGLSRNYLGFTQIEMRGVFTSDNEKLLLLVDGLPINTVKQGAARIDYFPLKLIKKIEVFRGPGSALYGSNAFYGIINIITKDAQQFNKNHVMLRYDGFSGMNLNTWAAGDIIGLPIAIYYDYFQTTGFPVAGNYPYKATATPIAMNWNADGITKHHIYVTSKLDQLDINSLFTISKRLNYLGPDFFLTPDSFTSNIGFNFKTVYEVKFSEQLTFDWKLYVNYDKQDQDYIQKVYTSAPDVGALEDLNHTRFVEETGLLGTEGMLTATLTETNKIVGGAAIELRDYWGVQQYGNKYATATTDEIITYQDFTDRIKSDSAHPTYKYLNGDGYRFEALYLQDIWDVSDELRVISGARYDFYSSFAGSFNPRLGLVWAPFDEHIIKASYGSAFRAPSIEQIYPSGPNQGTLQPEEVKAIQIALESELFKNFTNTLTWYSNDMINLIEKQDDSYYVDTNGDGTVGNTGDQQITAEKYINSGHILATGIEIESKYQIARGQFLGAHIGYQTPTVVSQQNARFSSTPKYRLTVFGNARLNQYINLHTELFWQSEIPYSLDTINKISSSSQSLLIPNTMTINSGISIKNGLGLLQSTDLAFNVMNLLDQKIIYPDAYFSELPGTGRLWIIEVSQRF